MMNDSFHLIGLMTDQNPYALIGILGILKSGNGFVPIDPGAPASRVELIIKDCRIKVLLTEEKHLAKALEIASRSGALTDIVCLDKTCREVTDCDVRIHDLDDYTAGELVETSGDVDYDRLAYVIFTSGSTGAPKGVPISQKQLATLFRWSQQYFNLGEHTRVLQSLSHWFDFGVFELLTTALSGGTLYYVEANWRGSLSRYIEIVGQHGINTIHSTPSFFREVIAMGEELPTLEILHLGGEPLSRGLVDDILAKAGDSCVLYNGYGPTEATINCSILDVGTRSAICSQESINIPIGRPSANNCIYILDKNNHPVAIGVAGELHVGGEALSQGYLGRPELTAEKFIPNPFSEQPGARLYKTGDLACYGPDGKIECLGRLDHQVKLRGFRIELGEIEEALKRHPAFKEAVVRIREDASGEKRLVGYCVPVQKQAPGNREVRSFLSQYLPDYMIPSTFIMLSAMPLTPNGKLDSRALPVPGKEMGEAGLDYVAPRTVWEEQLAEIWEELLRVKAVSIRDNFFELGGHSLLAMQLISRVQRLFQVDVSLRRLFETPTIEGLAQAIETAVKGGRLLAMPGIEKVRQGAELPLSYAQERLWFLDKLMPGTPTYNITRTTRLSWAVNVATLEQSLSEIIRRHEVLRTRYESREGDPFQVIDEPEAMRLPVVDLSGLSEGRRRSVTRGLARQEANRPFDLEQGPVIRGTVMREDLSQQWLLLSAHHIAIDGWSVDLLREESSRIYEAFQTGGQSPLRELQIQYRDYAAQQREWLQGEVLDEQMSYWKQHLAGSPALLELPLDRPRPAVATYRGSSQGFALSAELTYKLKQVSRRRGVTLFMTLLAAFQALLSRYSGQDDILVGTPIAMRNRIEVEGLIGFFVNTVVIRTSLSGDPRVGELLDRVREAVLSAHAHQDLPFEKLVSELRPERSLSYSPLFQVMFVLQNSAEARPEVNGAKEDHNPTAQGFKSGIEKFDLTLSMAEGGDRLTGAISYNRDLFDVTTIERMVTHLRRLLEGMAAEPDEQVSRLLHLTEAEAEWAAVKSTKKALPLPDQPGPDLQPAFVAPRDELELQLAAIWQEVLGIQRLGVRDNFFELGGNSLMAVRLLARVEKQIGERLPLATIFQGATIEHLASVLRKRAWTELPDVVVPIQTGGSRLPLFFVHPAGGLVFSYKALARRLGPDQPFYGLQARGIDKHQAAPSGIEEMAADYVEAIRAVQPEGPYLIGGWSLGGLVAFEMARNIQQQGGRVALLALIDTYAPGLFSKLFKGFRRENPQERIIAFSLHLGLPLDQLERSLSDLIDLEADEQLSYILELAKETGRLSPDTDLEKVRHLFRLLEAHADMIRSYHPQSIEGQVTAIQAAAPLSFEGARAISPVTRFLLRPLRIDRLVKRTARAIERRTRDWGRLASGGEVTYVVPGDHFSMMQEPQVRTLAERLRGCIDAAVGGGPAVSNNVVGSIAE